MNAHILADEHPKRGKDTIVTQSTNLGLYRKQLRLVQVQVGLAFFAFLLLGADDGALGVLIPSLRLQYNVDKATIGLLFLAQTVGYLTAAFNNGLLVEWLGNRRCLLIGVAVFLLVHNHATFSGITR